MPWVFQDPTPGPGAPLPTTPAAPLPGQAAPDPGQHPPTAQSSGGWVFSDDHSISLEVMRRSPDIQQAIQDLARKREQPWQKLQVEIARRAATEGRAIPDILREMGGSGTAVRPAQAQQPALPAPQAVQPPGPSFAVATTPSAPKQGVMQQLAQGDIIGAGTTAIGTGIQQGLVKPVMWGLGVLGKPAELTEQYLTGHQGYEQWFAQHGITNPTERSIAAIAARVVLDPTNVFMLPGVTEKALSIGARAATGGYRLAKATGVPEVAARSIGMIERGLLDNPVTGPSAKLVQTGFNNIRKEAQTARDMAFSMFDKTYKMPKEFRDMYRAWQGRTIDVIEAGKQELLNISNNFERDDRALLYKAMSGEHDVEDLSPKLRAEYDRLDGIRTKLTNLGVEQGFISHAIDNYIRRLYDDETLNQVDAIIKQGGIKSDEMKDAMARGNLQGGFISGGLKGGLAKQILPGPGALGTTVRAGMKRVFDTDAAARMAGKNPIEDVALSMPAHIWEFGLAHNTADFLRDTATLNEEWARRTGQEAIVMDAANAPHDWQRFGDIVGNPTADRTKLWADAARTTLSDEKKLADLRVSPRYAQFVKDMVGRTGDIPDYARLYGRVAGDIKKYMFFNVLFHGANVMRSAFLADGFKAFNPSRWLEMYRDGENFGPWIQAFYKSGGSVGTSTERAMANGLDDVMSLSGPAGQALKRAGLSWQELKKSPFKIPGAARDFSDHLLWDGLDRSGRLQVFRDFAEQAGIKEEHLAQLTVEQQQKLSEAADLTNKFMNNYSRTGMTKFEKGLANIFFTYSWNKGRLQLFGDMARSFVPGTALSAAERAAYQRGAMRWAITNMVVPHMVRAMSARASDGVWGAALPIGQQTRGGYTNTIYADPTGFYSDAAQFLSHPITWAWARANPLVRSIVDIVAPQAEARITGKSDIETAGQALAQQFGSYLPAGIPQALAPGRPWYARALPWVGVPVTTVPPRPEDPRIAMHEAIMRGDYATAAATIKKYQLGLLRTIGAMPAADRSQILKMYRVLFPTTRGGGGGGTGLGAGLGAGGGLGLPSELR